VSSDEVDRIFERIFLSAKLDVPGNGFMYATPLLQAATYVPPSILSKYAGQ
jgi:nitrogen regulatory protein P-II 1